MAEMTENEEEATRVDSLALELNSGCYLLMFKHFIRWMLTKSNTSSTIKIAYIYSKSRQNLETRMDRYTKKKKEKWR